MVIINGQEPTMILILRRRSTQCQLIPEFGEEGRSETACLGRLLHPILARVRDWLIIPTQA